jgi:hypothetical protein
MFGGNPGTALEGDSTAAANSGRSRLNDLWCLRLRRPVDPQALLSHCKFELARQHFGELCASERSRAQALRFLQTELTPQISNSAHLTAEQRGSLRSLLGQQLFDGRARDEHASRKLLLRRLIALLPERMRPPAVDAGAFVGIV